MSMSRDSGRACPVAVFTAIIFLGTGAAALAQRPSQADDYSALMQQICRQYAAAQRGMPADLMFDQCMSERHCRASRGPSGYQCELPGPLTWHGGGY
jgi:hypothetical protein